MEDNFYNSQALVSMAYDNVSGKHYQKVKIVWGADDTANNINTTAPLPIQSLETSSAWETSSQTVAVTAQWGTASASNTITITNFTLEALSF